MCSLAGDDNEYGELHPPQFLGWQQMTNQFSHSYTDASHTHKLTQSAPCALHQMWLRLHPRLQHSALSLHPASSPAERTPCHCLHPVPTHPTSTHSLLPCSFRLGRQEDAHEFLIALLDAMHEASIAGLQPKPAPELAQTSFIYRIFGGRMRSQVGAGGG